MGLHLGLASTTDDEIAHYDAWLGELPDSYRVRYSLAEAYERIGQPERALELCREALRQRPDHPYLIEMLERLEGRLVDHRSGSR